MIKAGLMDELPDACFALHVENGAAGKLMVGKRYLTAYSDGYTITVHGKAAHSSTPEEGVDAVYIAASIVTALHGLVSRNLSPMARATLNIGVIHGGTAPNIIADEVTLKLMMRNLSKESREAMIEKIEKISVGTAEALGGSCDLEFHAGYSAVYNDENFSDFVADTFRKYSDGIYEGLGDGRPEDWLVTGENPLLGAEDFGFYSEKAPSCLIWVGVGGDAPKQPMFPCGRAVHQALHARHGHSGIGIPDKIGNAPKAENLWIFCFFCVIINRKSKGILIACRRETKVFCPYERRTVCII